VCPSIPTARATVAARRACSASVFAHASCAFLRVGRTADDALPRPLKRRIRPSGTSSISKVEPILGQRLLRAETCAVARDDERDRSAPKLPLDQLPLPAVKRRPLLGIRINRENRSTARCERTSSTLRRRSRPATKARRTRESCRTRNATEAPSVVFRRQDPSSRERAVSLTPLHELVAGRRSSSCHKTQ